MPYLFSDNDVEKNDEVIFNAFEIIEHHSLPVYVSNFFFQSETNSDDDDIVKFEKRFCTHFKLGRIYVSKSSVLKKTVTV